MKNKNSSAFTFVELLVVVTIIAVITAVAVASYQSTNRKARDSRRKSDLEQMRAALELCRAETGEYPETGGMDFDPIGQELVCLDGNTYLNPLPQDPRQGQVGYGYEYTQLTDTTYELCATTMEADGDGYTEGEEYCVDNP